jgi:tetratricopeptide (TPR) repeat protein
MEMITLGLRLNPADLDSRITLSEVLVQQGRTEEALIELRVAAQLFPSKALPLEKIADLSYRLNFLDDALAFYRLAIQVDERRVHAYVQSGRIFLERDRPAEAAEMLRAAITRDPRYPTAAELLEKAQLAADAKAR